MAEYRELRARQLVLENALNTCESDGRPIGLRAANGTLTAPTHTNNREAARAQAYERLYQAAQNVCARVAAMEQLLPQVLEALPEDRLKIIAQPYYADQQTDESIGGMPYLSPRHVNRLRHMALDMADKAGDIAWV